VPVRLGSRVSGSDDSQRDPASPPPPGEELDADSTATTAVTGNLRERRRRETGDASAAVEPGTRIGRYVVTGRLGEGGMGMVCSAWDPDLDRKVAVKILRARDDSERARSRLLREAQALARLSHPNVVNVHDVGTTDDRVFIAMEHLDGATLKGWLRERPRRWHEIVGVFAAVGRGLAAAHDAGIVHRDIKPSNILIETTGRVRILDFGVARWVETDAGTPPSRPDHEAPLPASQDDNPPSGTTTEPLTHAGALVGTPPYMAPEQKRGEATTATDQYSFSVSLFESLVGRRPQSADDARQQRSLPRWLTRVLARGLARDPGERFASMAALTHELHAGLRRRRRRPWLAAAAAAAAAASVGAAVIAGGVAPAPCSDAGASIDSVWNQRARDDIRARFGESGRPHAGLAFASVSEALDRRAARWRDTRVEACKDTLVRGIQSDRLMDLRMHCLDRVRARFGALVSVFRTDADGDVVDRSLEAVNALSDVAPCNDARRLEQATPLPNAPEQRAAIADVREALDQAAARESAGRYQAALETVAPLAGPADETAFAPVVAETRALLGDLQHTTGDLEAAESSYHAALAAAARAKDDAMTARLWIRLVGLIGHEGSRYDDALALEQVTRYAMARAESPAEDRARLANNLGLIYAGRGDHERSQAFHEQALALQQDHLGKAHPSTAVSLTNIGNALNARGELDRARQALERAVAIDEKHVGAWHPEVASSYVNLARVLANQGEFDEAEKLYGRALQIWTESLGANHPRIAATIINLGDLLLNRGDAAQAYEQFTRGRSILVRALGADHPHVGLAVVNQAEAQRVQQRCTQAAQLYREAIGLWQKSLGDSHPYMGFALTGLGLCLIELDQARDALAILERAATIHEQDGGDGLQRARTRFAIARALPRSQRARATELALAAREELATLGDGAAAERAAVDSWLGRRISVGRE